MELQGTYLLVSLMALLHQIFLILMLLLLRSLLRNLSVSTVHGKVEYHVLKVIDLVELSLVVFDLWFVYAGFIVLSVYLHFTRIFNAVGFDDFVIGYL